MNILYGFLDATESFGRFLGMLFLIFFAMGLVGFFIFEALILAGVAVGGGTLLFWIDNPPEFLTEFLGSKLVSGD